MKITTVLGTKLVIKKLAEETRTSGGLYVPNTATEDTLKGEVKFLNATGVLMDGETKVGDFLTPGDLVLVRIDYNSSIKVTDEDHGECYVVDANNVLCVFENTNR